MATMAHILLLRVFPFLHFSVCVTEDPWEKGLFISLMITHKIYIHPEWMITHEIYIYQELMITQEIYIYPGTKL